MSIWDKFGFGKDKEQKSSPQTQEDLLGASLTGAMSTQRVEQLLAGSRSKPTEAPTERQARLSHLVEDHLKDVVPGAKDGLKKASDDLRTFPNPNVQAHLAERYNHLVHAPGVAKPPLAEWLSSQREDLINKLSDAEEYHIVAQHMDDAFREAGKNPEQAIALLEQKAAILNTEVAGLERQGGKSDRVSQLRLQAKRLYHAANKLDELIQNK